MQLLSDICLMWLRVWSPPEGPAVPPRTLCKASRLSGFEQWLRPLSSEICAKLGDVAGFLHVSQPTHKQQLISPIPEQAACSTLQTLCWQSVQKSKLGWKRIRARRKIHLFLWRGGKGQRWLLLHWIPYVTFIPLSEEFNFNSYVLLPLVTQPELQGELCASILLIHTFLYLVSLGSV